MSMTESLFGGLITVVILYFVARVMRLSNYWSGVISGTLPFLIYLGLSANNWPGGDVLAIHFVVFLATAGVLGVFSSIRRKNEKMHWGPKVIITFFALLVVFNATLVSIAINGMPNWLARMVMPHADRPLHTGFSGALPHDRNHLYEEHQQRVEAQRNLGWQLKLAGLDNARKGVVSDVVLSVMDASGAPIETESATMGLWRVANTQDDKRLALEKTGPGTFHASVTFSDAGRWIVELEVKRGTDTHLTQQPLVVAE